MVQANLGERVAAPMDVLAELDKKKPLMLPAPPATRSGRAARAVLDSWNRLRNDTRLLVEDHMITAPLVTLTAGFLAGCLLRVMLAPSRDQPTRR